MFRQKARAVIRGICRKNETNYMLRQKTMTFVFRNYFEDCVSVTYEKSKYRNLREKTHLLKFIDLTFSNNSKSLQTIDYRII